MTRNSFANYSVTLRDKSAMGSRQVCLRARECLCVFSTLSEVLLQGLVQWTCPCLGQLCLALPLTWPKDLEAQLPPWLFLRSVSKRRGSLGPSLMLTGLQALAELVYDGNQMKQEVSSLEPLKDNSKRGNGAPKKVCFNRFCDQVSGSMWSF